MEDVKKNFGFGLMRLPMIEREVDIEETIKMVDSFLQHGFNYFDTAHGYIGGKSEKAIKIALTSRYPRESYVLTNKLSSNFFNSQQDIRPLFLSQLDACGVEYFDYYLMHAQGSQNFPHYQQCQAYQTAFELKKEGYIKHVGISFHDTPEVLEQILTEYPQIEVVQIQLNYIDFDDVAIQSRRCLEVCNKYNKPVIVMEPCKGGNLANLKDNQKAIFNELSNNSCASYAIRFAASQKGVHMVLSGMSNLAQMEDNLSFMTDFKPIEEKEMAAIERVKEEFNKIAQIACTGCRYCVDGCPMQIKIPDLFALYNHKIVFDDYHCGYFYRNSLTVGSGKASDCIECGQCEDVCPQHLMIRDNLKQIAKVFETEEK